MSGCKGAWGMGCSVTCGVWVPVVACGGVGCLLLMWGVGVRVVVLWGGGYRV